MPETTYSPDPRPSPLQFPPSRGYGNIRERVTTARTYYVAASGGSDTFNGLTPGAAFATLSKAIDIVHGLDIAANVNVTVQLMDGAHTIAAQLTIRNYSGIGQVIIQGNTNDVSAVTLTATTNSISMLSFIGAGVSRWVVQHFTMVGKSGNTAISLDGNSRLSVGNMSFGSGFTQAINCANNSYCAFIGSAYTISGSMTQFILVQRNAFFLCSTTGTWTLSGTPAFTAFVSVLDHAGLRISSASVTFSGSATGNRYSASGLSLIQTNGGGANFFPGSVAGSTADNSVYA